MYMTIWRTWSTAWSRVPQVQQIILGCCNYLSLDRVRTRMAENLFNTQPCSFHGHKVFVWQKHAYIFMAGARYILWHGMTQVGSWWADSVSVRSNSVFSSLFFVFCMFLASILLFFLFPPFKLHPYLLGTAASSSRPSSTSSQLTWLSFFAHGKKFSDSRYLSKLPSAPPCI